MAPMAGNRQRLADSAHYACRPHDAWSGRFARRCCGYRRPYRFCPRPSFRSRPDASYTTGPARQSARRPHESSTQRSNEGSGDPTYLPVNSATQLGARRNEADLALSVLFCVACAMIAGRRPRPAQVACLTERSHRYWRFRPLPDFNVDPQGALTAHGAQRPARVEFRSVPGSAVARFTIRARVKRGISV